MTFHCTFPCKRKHTKNQFQHEKNSMNHHSINIIITINDVLYKKKNRMKVKFNVELLG